MLDGKPSNPAPCTLSHVKFTQPTLHARLCYPGLLPWCSEALPLSPEIHLKSFLAWAYSCLNENTTHESCLFASHTSLAPPSRAARILVELSTPLRSLFPILVVILENQGFIGVQTEDGISTYLLAVLILVFSQQPFDLGAGSLSLVERLCAFMQFWAEFGIETLEINASSLPFKPRPDMNLANPPTLLVCDPLSSSGENPGASVGIRTWCRLCTLFRERAQQLRIGTPSQQCSILASIMSLSAKSMQTNKVPSNLTLGILADFNSSFDELTMARSSLQLALRDDDTTRTPDKRSKFVAEDFVYKEDLSYLDTLLHCEIESAPSSGASTPALSRSPSYSSSTSNSTTVCNVATPYRPRIASLLLARSMYSSKRPAGPAVVPCTKTDHCSELNVWYDLKLEENVNVEASYRGRLRHH